MSKPPKPKYRTTNWSAYNESLRKRGALLLWIDKDMEWVGLPTASGGAHPHSPMRPSSSADDQELVRARA